ncbi:MAG: hypothetical protein HC906_04765 [Bacteroidales bacterium]|nr:hypothetical protein [Bacteroidales bacterium]
MQKLKSFLEANFNGEYSLETIDILTSPELAIKDNILASPTLIKEKPNPPKRIVGGLNWENLLQDFSDSKK